MALSYFCNHPLDDWRGHGDTEEPGGFIALHLKMPHRLTRCE
jgi:hypothetical protein